MLRHESFGPPYIAVRDRANDFTRVLGFKVDLHDGARPSDMHVRRRMIILTSKPASRMSVGTAAVYRRPSVFATASRTRALTRSREPCT